MLTLLALRKLAPRQLPSLSTTLESLGNPPARDVAAALDVHARTVSRWIAVDQAPRTASLALYWLTPHGHATLDADRENAAAHALALAQALSDENLRLRRELARLAALGNFDSANTPLAPDERLPGPARIPRTG